MKLSSLLFPIGISALGAWALPNLQPEPTPFVGQTISIEMVKKAAAEFGLPVENLQRRASSVSASASVRPVNPHEDKYLIPVQVGSQVFDVVLDTGSSGLPTQTIYTPGSTATATSVVGLSYSAVFQGNNTAAAGEGYIDNVAIGSATATQMTFGVATSLAAPASEASGTKSGIIGLSFSSGQSGYQKNGSPVSPPPPTFLNRTLDILAKRLFTLDLRQDGTGTLDLGFINTNKINQSITYANRNPSLNSGNWFITPGPYYVNGTQGTAGAFDFYHPDSGALFMYFPQAIVEDFYNKMGTWSFYGSYYSFPCDKVKDPNFPSFGVNFGGTIFTIPPEYMWWRKNMDRNNTCTGALQVGNIGGSGGTKGAILGEMFLKTVYAVYDFDGNTKQGRVGFASKSVPPHPVPTS